MDEYEKYSEEQTERNAEDSQRSSRRFLVLVCGSRAFDNYEIVYKTLKDWNDALGGISIISGGAHGADTMAEDAARSLKIPITVVYADWKKHGKLAGKIRNTKMLDMHPDYVLAFRQKGVISSGTRDTLTKAETRGITTVEVWND